MPLDAENICPKYAEQIAKQYRAMDHLMHNPPPTISAEDLKITTSKVREILDEVFGHKKDE
jgi:hypothetical protein